MTPFTTVATRAVRLRAVLRIGLIAGFAGGVAEIAWIALYAQLSGTDAAAVAGGVTGTLFPALAAGGAAASIGVALHVGLALMLGVALAVLLRLALPGLRRSWREPAAVVAALVAVWAVNFLVVLPAINPDFVALVPPLAGLVSKVLFGAAAASVFHYRTRR